MTSRVSRNDGVTLIELVVVLALLAILVTMVLSWTLTPFHALGDVTRRAALVDSAETALRRMARDVRAGLPNSVRVSPDGRAVELIHVEDGGRYRDGPGTNPVGSVDHTSSDDWLAFHTVAGDARFNLLGQLHALAFTPGVPLPGRRVAVYTTDTGVYAQAATGANPGVITAAGDLTITLETDEHRIELAAPHRFPYESPSQRLYVVDGPVSWVCDPVAGTLTRYSGYAYAASQPTDPALAPLSGASAGLAAEDVASCAFTYAPGTPWRAGLLSAAIELRDGAEVVYLLHQVHVENTP